MFHMQLVRYWILIFIMSFLTSSCYHPPYNNFKPYHRIYKNTAIGAGAGTLVGAAVGTTLMGTGIGAIAFAAFSLNKDTKANIIHNLRKKGDIKFEHYGDTMTLIVPTDRYYLFNSAQLNELCYHGLVSIVKLLKFYPKCAIYVAGFTDDIGSEYHKNRLSQARAETMIAFLWSFGIESSRLHAEGYGDKNDISDNQFIHGSAQNRRVEIQWVCSPNQVEGIAFRRPWKK